MAPRPLIEVAVDSAESAAAAAAAGANRLELCARLDQDGLTPSLELFEQVRQRVAIPIHVMIRSRPGDFRFDPREAAEMGRQLDRFRAAGAAGFVIGSLTGAGEIDRPSTADLVRRAAGRPVTFHRAFDRLADPLAALPTLPGLGISRVLTSGGAESAFLGRAVLARYVAAAPPGLVVLAGGGIRADHVVRLVRETDVAELHLAGVRRGSAGGADPERVRAVVAALAAERT